MGKTKIRYGWGFILLKMLKYGTAGDLIWYSWGSDLKDEKVNFEEFISWKRPKKCKAGDLYQKKD